LKKKKIDSLYLINRSFINRVNLHTIDFFKEVLLMDKVKPLSKQLLLNNYTFNEKYLFDLEEFPGYAELEGDEPVKREVMLKEKNIYTKSFF